MSQPLPRYRQSPIHTDPLEAMLARRQAEHERARTAINNGRNLNPDPADLRGIPCIARGVGGTSPGTNPLAAFLQAERRTPTLRSVSPIVYHHDVG